MQLYACGNYHWYLKQSLEFSGLPSDRVSACVWDLEHEYVLHVMCSGGQYTRYRWAWTTHCSGGGDASVVVIDACEEVMLMTESNGSRCDKNNAKST